MEKPKTLQQAIRHFSDEQVCIDTVASLRWAEWPGLPQVRQRWALLPRHSKTLEVQEVREAVLRQGRHDI
jgi:uncharacterized protein YqcC (DUF446 family)